MAGNLFAACRTLLSVCSQRQLASGEHASVDTARHEASQEALELLSAIDYLQVDRPGGPLRATAEDEAAARNRLALLGLASRLERVFTLPSRHAPGAVFVGAEVAPARFGLPAIDRPIQGVGGKGMTLRAAFEGCIGEAAEYLSLLDWGDRRRFSATPDKLYPPSGRPATLADGVPAQRDGGSALAWMLAGIDGGQSVPAGAIDWVKARRLDDEEELPVPLDLCLRRQSPGTGPPLRKAESNGCSAGTTLQAAQYGALMELVERDAVALWWYGGRPAHALAVDGTATPELGAWIEALRDAAARRHWFLDLTSDLGIPVVAALSCDEKGGTVISGFAADLDPAQALRSALLEMCQMELALDLVELKIEQRGMEALNDVDRHHLERRRHLRLEAYPRLTADPRSERPVEAKGIPKDRRLKQSLDAIAAAGYAAYGIDLTRPEVAIPVARVLVPGLQSAKTDWISDRLRQCARDKSCNSSDWKCLPAII